jgi:hypothetical protein
MAVTQAEHYYMLNHSGARTTADSVATIGGIALAVLGALALEGVSTFLFVAINNIIAGIVLILLSGEISIDVGRLTANSSGTGERPATFDVPEFGGGMGAGVMAGIAGLVLGALGIIGWFPVVLAACAQIVFGAALVFDLLNLLQVRSARVIVSASSTTEAPARPAAPVLPAMFGANFSCVLEAAALITLAIIALVAHGSGLAAGLVAIAYITLGGFFIVSGLGSTILGGTLSVGMRGAGESRFTMRS